MYDVNKTVSTIKATAKEQNVSITTMLEEIGINKNTLSSMKSRGSWVSSDTLAKIADYEKRIAHLKKQVERLEGNLDFREKMIDRKDGTISKLLDSINHKDEIIEKLLKDKMKE